MTIVDRGLGQIVPAGAWEAVWYQATHDSSGFDVGFEREWPHIVTVRGAYHFARPGSSTGTEQATLFVNRVVSQGWNHGHDLWALDIEVDGLAGATLYQWIIDFMEVTKSHLGDRGFLYIGFPFYRSHVSTVNFSLLSHYRWWLPDYGPNDGFEHAISAPAVVQPLVKLHQYSSTPFDQSSIVDRAAWDALFVAAPPPTPLPTNTTDVGDNVKLTDTDGVPLDTDGNGHISVPFPAAQIVAVTIFGGTSPEAARRYDQTPVTRLVPRGTATEVVITGGLPNGKYTVRVAHV